jgi:NitT/TauT family transport system permease protein
MSARQHRINPNDTTIPTASQIQEGINKITKVSPRGETWLLKDAEATLYRLFLGITLSVVISLIIGLLMGCFAFMEALLLPINALLAKLPPTAMLAVFFVLAGTDTTMFTTMIIFGLTPTISQTIYLNVKQIPMEIIYKSYTLGCSSLEVIYKIVFRMVLPAIIDSIRLSIGPAMVYLIAAEMVVGDVGFGYRIRIQSRLLNMSVVYTYLALLAGFGFAMDFILKMLKNKLCKWQVS